MFLLFLLFYIDFISFNSWVTPVIIATRKGYNVIVAELIRAGADPKKKDLIGQTAFEYANAKTLAVLNYEIAALEEHKKPIEEEEEDQDEDT